MTNGWIGVDLDGTLAEYHGWGGEESIGEPIPEMVERVKIWLEMECDVRIFTARVCNGQQQIKHIEDWCLKHLGKVLPVTNVKDFEMIVLWDDRCIQVEMNTGRRIDGQD